MAKTVTEAFELFLSTLTPSSTETQKAKDHRASIDACLKANFQITRFFRSGSFGNGTSIRGYSDVDYFASIPPAQQRPNSYDMLRAASTVLDTRFPRTGVRINTPAVLVPFGTDISEWTEVVPSYLMGTKDQECIYGIANGASGWMPSSPDAHNKYVTLVDNRLKGKLKPVVRFIKAWKYYNDVPASSFYLELHTTYYASTQTIIVYSIDVQTVLRRMWDSQLADFADPLGVSADIMACDSITQKKVALDKLVEAVVRADNAREAETNGKTEDALYWWNLVFDGNFPRYS